MHLGDHQVEAVEALLRAQVGDQLDFQPLAVDIAFEIKDMGFQQRIAQASGRGAAEIGDAGAPVRLAFDPGADGIDARPGMDQFAELKVCRSKAELAAVLLAG